MLKIIGAAWLTWWQGFLHLLIAATPDYHPRLDKVLNAVSAHLPVVPIYDVAIHVAILLLVGTPREIQLSKSQYETRKLKTDYDFIVVGGGTTGCMIANRLVSRTNMTVLIIEAGGVNNYVNVFPFINSLNVNYKHFFNMNWHLRTTPQHQSHIYTDAHLDRTSFEGGGKGLGGTSQINWQIYSRGFPVDYDNMENKFGAQGWNFKSMLPAMKESAFQNGYEGFQPSEMLHSLESTPGVDQISVSIASNSNLEQITGPFSKSGAQVTGTSVLHDHNSNQLGFGRMQFDVQLNGYTGHSGRRFIYPIRNNPRDERNKRLHIMLDTEVTKINFVKNNNELRATSVETPERSFNVRHDVIVTAGFFGTPAVLLQSGLGPTEDLARLKIPEVANISGVGRNLHNHQSALGIPVTFMHGKNYSDVSIKQLLKAFIDGSGRFRMDYGVTGVGFDIINDKWVTWKEDRPNVEYILYYPSIGLDTAKRIFVDNTGLHKDIFDKFYVHLYGGTHLRPRETVFATVTLLHSDTRGTVTLDDDGELLINYQYLSDDVDLNTQASGYARLSRILYMAYSPAGGVLPNKPLPGCEDPWHKWMANYADSDPNQSVYEPFKQCVEAAAAGATEDVRRCLDESITAEERDYFKCYGRHLTSSAWHMGGTARMGSCDDTEGGAVVDARCKVCGTSNLRITDASTLPEPLSGHVMATLFGITERCTRFTIEDNS